MPSQWGKRRKCKHCGVRYPDFRTGYTFALVKQEMWSADHDPATWRYRRRHSVLGYWHKLKLRMWHHHLDECEDAAPPF